MWTQQRNRRKKPCTDSSIGSCVRACVTDARATVYVCVHMPKEVYEKEKMYAHAAEDAGSSAEKEYSIQQQSSSSSSNRFIEHDVNTLTK